MTRILVNMMILLVLVPGQGLAGPQVTTGIDTEAGLPYWELRDGPLALRLVQRLPDQTRAFFMGRGFTTAQAERIAQSCVFQSVYKNTAAAGSTTVIDYDLTAWQVRHGGKLSRLKVREDWRSEWQQAKAKSAAAIAFEWSLLPTRQRYQANDYNWGMTIYNLPPGSKFDLEVVWQEDGERKTATINAIECAPDIHPEPES